MSNRQKLIAQIHIGKQQLGLDDDTYRALLKSATGKTSSANMGVMELHKVIESMKQRGFKVKGKSDGKPHNINSDGMPKMMKKVEALLTDQQLPWSYADGIAKQMFGIDRCSWLTGPEQVKAIIAALYARQKKQRTKPGGSQ